MEARKVHALHGWMWIKHSFWLFKKNPLLWMVMTSIGVVGTVTLSSIPLIGDLLSTILFPSLLAGYMLGCHALAQGKKLELAHMIAGIQQHTHKLITLGGISLIGQLLILGVMMGTGGKEVVSIMMNGRAGAVDPAVLLEAVSGAQYSMLLGTVLFFTLMMTLQFAPMLVVFGQMAPIPALKSSLRAFTRNMIPLSVYSLLLLPLAFLASMPMMLGWLVLLPIIITSLYAIYRDLFPMEGDVADGNGEENGERKEIQTDDQPQI